MTRLNLHLQKDTPVSIHEQLVTQISLQIANGQIQAGDSLPSVRSLSKQLDVHYNTCLAVYKTLIQQGLLKSQPGRAVVVKSLETPPNTIHQFNTDFEACLQQWAQWIETRKWDWQNVLSELSRLSKANPAKAVSNIFFLDAHADILPIFQHELEAGLGCPVTCQTLDLTFPEVIPEASLILVSRYHYGTASQRLQQKHNLVCIEVGQIEAAIERLKLLPEGSFVAVISCSATILNMAHVLISSLRAEALLLGTALNTDDMEHLRTLIKHAHLILCDQSCAGWLSTITQKPIHVFRLTDSEQIRGLKQQYLSQTLV